MQCTGKIVEVNKNVISDRWTVHLEINENVVNQLQTLAKRDKLSISIKKDVKRRSLDANAYFHVLVGKIADSLRISKIRCKNILICRYGQQDFNTEGKPIVLKANIDVSSMLEQETLHCLPCGEKIENGTVINFYKVYRGSHTYNTEEMSILIDGTVSEAKELGIDTMSPRELQEMKERWHL